MTKPNGRSNAFEHEMSRAARPVHQRHADMVIHWLLRLGLFVVAMCSMTACRSKGSRVSSPKSVPTPAMPPEPASAESPRDALPPKRPPSPLDAIFEGYQKKLPEPATLSEGNGATLECPHHGYVTYTLIRASAEKLQVKDDADLIALAYWARDVDPCIRQIALDALLPKIGFDSNKLAVPVMHEIDHYEYHEIFVAVKAHFDGRRIAYPPSLFDGMMIDIGAGDWETSLQGHWQEDAKGKNFQTFLEISGKTLRVTRHEVHDDPGWPDHTMTSEVSDVRVNAQKQLVVGGAWRQESNAKGFVGKKLTPSDLTYSFWPVSRDVMWFREGPDAYWDKMIRVKK